MMKLKLKHPEKEKPFSCGDHPLGMPNYTYYDALEQEGTINGKTVVFTLRRSYYWAKRINFKYNGKAYYFDDQKFADRMRKIGKPIDLTFTAELVEVDRKQRSRDFSALFGGRTRELIADSKTAQQERNDCTVKALMECLQIKYDKAHAMFKPYRRERHGFPLGPVLARDFKDKFEEVKLPKRMTLGTFVRDHCRRSERYIVTVTGHALCVAEGKIYDHSIKPGRKIVQVFKRR